MSSALKTAAILSVILGLGALVRGQDAERLAPKTPPANPPAQIVTSTPSPRPSGNVELLRELKGIVFVDAPDKIRSASQVRGISTEQARLVDSAAFRGLFKPYLGHPLTSGTLDEICAKVVTYCRKIDRPVVDAIVPQQDITNGTVQILLLEGRVGQVRAEGNRFFTSKLLLGAVRAQPAQEISQNQILEDADWLNRNPFRQTDVIFERGQELGQTDLVLHTQDHFPVRPYIGYENTGTESTGEDRYFTGINWGDAFGLDQQLNYQFTMNSDVQRFWAHSGSYVIPLPWRNQLTILGNFSSSEVQTFPGIFQSGQGWQLSGRYEIPLPRLGGLSQSIVLGGDFKRTNTNADFGGSSVYSSFVDIVQFMGGYNAERVDRFGSTAASAQFFFSPGNIGGQDNAQDYQNARAGAEARYEYLNATVLRVTNLPENFSLATRFAGQVASAPLLPTEQLGLGGMDSVRGYLEEEAEGDDGIIFSNELRTPSLSFFPKLKDALFLYGFVDYGVAWTRDAQVGQQSQTNFLGVGPGVSYRVGPWFSVNYDYGWRLARGDLNVQSHGRHNLRVLASILY
jgi:hemolysin activation/secretion protein